MTFSKTSCVDLIPTGLTEKIDELLSIPTAKAGRIFKFTRVPVRINNVNKYADSDDFVSIGDRSKSTTLANIITDTQQQSISPSKLSSLDVEIHPHILDISLKDQLFDVILSDIVQNTKILLQNKQYKFNVRIDFSEDREYPDWNHADVVIQIAEEDYDRVLDLWDEVSTNVEEYFNKTKIDPQDHINADELDRLSDFINIRLITGE